MASKPDLEKMKRERDVKALIRVMRMTLREWKEMGYGTELSQWSVTITEAIRALGEIGDKTVVPILLEEIIKKPWDVATRKEFASALRKIGDETAVPTLIKALKDEDEHGRYSAASALGVIGDRRAVPALIESLKDKSKVVRLDAAEALGEIGDDKAVPGLAGALRDKNDNVSWAAALALAKIGEVAVPALVEGLKDKRWRVRHNASEVLSNRNRRYSPVNLARIAGKIALPTLSEALKDRQWSVRYNVAYILGEVGDKRAVKPLYNLLNDKDGAVSTAAREALKKIE